MSPTVEPSRRPPLRPQSAFTHVVITLSLSLFILASPSHAFPSEPAGLPLAAESMEWQDLPKAASVAVSIDGPYESSPSEGTITEDSTADASLDGAADGAAGSTANSTRGNGKQAGDVLFERDGRDGFGEHDVAIGPQHMVQVLREKLLVRTRSGGFSVFYNMSQLFASVWFTGNTAQFGEVHYSPEHDRFVLATRASHGFPAYDSIVVAISRTADPFDGWWLYRIAGEGFLSSLSITADTWGVYVSADVSNLSSERQASALWVFDTAMVRGAAASAWRFRNLTWPDGSDARGVRGAIPHTRSSEDSTFFLNTRGSSGSDVLLWRLTGDRTHAPALVKRSVSVQPYRAIGAKIRQPGTATRIDGGDAAAYHVVYGYRRVYAVWTSDPDGDGSSSEIVSVKINTDSAQVVTTQRISGGEGSYYWQPSLVVNGGDGPLLDTGVFYMQSRASNLFPTPAFQILQASGQRRSGVFRAGSSVAPSSGSVAPWPAFAGASFDWFDPGRAWVSYSYIGPNLEWRTSIASVALDDEPQPGAGGGDTSSCYESATTACLLNRRFELTVNWRTQDGNSGPGFRKPIAGSDNSMLFWFFDEGNIELLAKVLDGCGFNDYFWVFSAATTNVEYTFTVRDTSSGRSVQYFNRQGDPAPAVTDTSAFPCG